MFGWATDLTTTRHAVGLPAVVAHMTDLHLDRVAVRPAAVRRALDLAGVQVVALTGDFFDRHYLPAALDEWIDALGARPTVAVLGNHDFRLGAGHRRALEGQLDRRGIALLRNAAATVGGVRFWGLDDPVTWHCQETAPEGPADLVLAHSVDLPFPLDALPAPLLCGHYHGGQVRILPGRLLARFVLRRERLALEQGILSGWTPDGRAYIGRGIGMSHMKVRLFAAPEIAVFT